MTEFLGAPLNVCPSESLTYLILVLTWLPLAVRTQLTRALELSTCVLNSGCCPLQRMELPFFEPRGVSLFASRGRQ